MPALPMNFDAVLSAFRHPSPIPVYDTTGEYVDGEWTETDPVLRGDISAIVLAMKTADLEFYREGYSTDSGISLHTKDTLFWTDINSRPEGQESRQSYVDYQGYRFRVVGTGFMFGNTNFNIYHCVRYVK